MIIKASYPNHFKNFDKDTIRAASEMWHRQFADYSFEVCFTAVERYIAENTFPPAIADIREIVVKMMNPAALKTGEEAWEEVITAVRKYGYYQQPEAFKQLDEPTKRAVKIIGWQNICQSEKIGIERAAFIKTYSNASAPIRERAILPTPLFKHIEQLKERVNHERHNDGGPPQLRGM